MKRSTYLSRVTWYCIAAGGEPYVILIERADLTNEPESVVKWSLGEMVRRQWGVEWLFEHHIFFLYFVYWRNTPLGLAYWACMCACTCWSQFLSDASSCSRVIAIDDVFAVYFDIYSCSFSFLFLFFSFLLSQNVTNKMPAAYDCLVPIPDCRVRKNHQPLLNSLAVYPITNYSSTVYISGIYLVQAGT